MYPPHIHPTNIYINSHIPKLCDLGFDPHSYEARKVTDMTRRGQNLRESKMFVAALNDFE